EDTNEMNFQDTIGREDDPDYEEYDLIVREFDQMKYKDGVEPLTDQEFSFYLKMDMYSTLLGGSRYGGARTYLQWDLGKDVYEDTNEMNFQDTIGREDDPDYEEYDLIVREFDQMKYKDGVEPLTDQEFSFYLKMDMYSTLLGGSRYGGARTYLQWDLGKDVYKDGIVSIEKEFEEFKDRHLELNGQVTYYDNEYLLKQEMVIDNPQFLLFVTEDEIEEDPLEAQKRLLELNEDLYKRPLEEYVEDKSNDLSEEFEGEGTEEGTNGEN